MLGGTVVSLQPNTGAPCYRGRSLPGVGAWGGATRTPRQPERAIACCTNPDALISSMNWLM